MLYSFSILLKFIFINCDEYFDCWNYKFNYMSINLWAYDKVFYSVTFSGCFLCMLTVIYKTVKKSVHAKVFFMWQDYKSSNACNFIFINIIMYVISCLHVLANNNSIPYANWLVASVHYCFCHPLKQFIVCSIHYYCIRQCLKIINYCAITRYI